MEESKNINYTEKERMRKLLSLCSNVIYDYSQLDEIILKGCIPININDFDNKYEYIDKEKTYFFYKKIDLFK